MATLWFILKVLPGPRATQTHGNIAWFIWRIDSEVCCYDCRVQSFTRMPSSQTGQLARANRQKQRSLTVNTIKVSLQLYVSTWVKGRRNVHKTASGSFPHVRYSSCRQSSPQQPNAPLSIALIWSLALGGRRRWNPAFLPFHLFFRCSVIRPLWRESPLSRLSTTQTQIFSSASYWGISLSGNTEKRTITYYDYSFFKVIILCNVSVRYVHSETPPWWILVSDPPKKYWFISYTKIMNKVNFFLLGGAFLCNL